MTYENLGFIAFKGYINCAERSASQHIKNAEIFQWICRQCLMHQPQPNARRLF